jgi:hypothetical protein
LLREDDAMAAAPELRRLTKGLRGTAQLAREDAVFQMACALEGAAHALVEGELTWSTDVRERVERTLGDLGVILAGAEPAHALRARLQSASERWRALGVAPWTPGTAGETASSQPVESAGEAFLTFAAAETLGIIDVLQGSLNALAEDPMDREPMKSVLRRQRALLGAARLEEVPVIAETLRAMEDVSRIIARMNVPIKDEWLDVFRCARLVLESSSGPLQRGQQPPRTPALSRLRTYRQELLERYGGGEEVSTGSLRSEPQPAQAAAQVAAPVVLEPLSVTTAHSDERPVDIQNLVYTGDAALRRALELRSRLEHAVEHDPDALALVDEVFDLIRLGLQ